MLSVRRPSPEGAAFFALFLFVLVARGGAAHVSTALGVDGGYYLGVAEQVRHGEGIASNLSIYNFGYPSFPAQTCIYPAWPLLLGTVARFVDLEEAAHWLPWTLYMGGGAVAWALGRALFPGRLFARLPGLDAGLVLAALYWLNPVLLRFSVQPYTEALAWGALVTGLWRFARRRHALGVGLGLEVGAWSVLAYFARAQLMVFPLALLAAVALRLVVGPDRARVARFGAAVAAPVVAATGAWWAHVTQTTIDHGLTPLLRFDRCQVNDLLPPMRIMVETDGPLELLQDRLQGVKYAWGFAKESYEETFEGLQWALPLAAVVALVVLVRERRGLLRRGWARLRADDATFWATVVLLAGGALLSVHLVHKVFTSPWYFDEREGLPAGLAFVVAAMWLLRRGWLAAALGAVPIGLSLAAGLQITWQEARFHEVPRVRDEFDRLAAALRAIDAATPGPLVVALEEGAAQRTAWRTPEIGYHWVSSRSTYATVGVMVKDLGADVVIWDNPRESWAFLRNGGHLEAAYARLEKLPWPWKGVEPRSTPLPEAAPRRVLLVAVEGIPGKRLPGRFSRFDLASADARSWPRIGTGRSRGGVPVWDLAARAGRRVGLYSWPGRKEAATLSAVLDGLAADDLSVVHIGEDRRADLDALLTAAPEDRLEIVVEIGAGEARDAVWVAGTDVQRTLRTKSVVPDDIAPTVAWLLRLGVATDLKGRVLSDLLAWDAAGALGRTDVARW